MKEKKSFQQFNFLEKRKLACEKIVLRYNTTTIITPKLVIENKKKPSARLIVQFDTIAGSLYECALLVIPISYRLGCYNQTVTIIIPLWTIIAKKNCLVAY